MQCAPRCVDFTRKFNWDCLLVLRLCKRCTRSYVKGLSSLLRSGGFWWVDSQLLWCGGYVSVARALM